MLFRATRRVIRPNGRSSVGAHLQPLLRSGEQRDVGREVCSTRARRAVILWSYKRWALAPIVISDDTGDNGFVGRMPRRHRSGGIPRAASLQFLGDSFQW